MLSGTTIEFPRYPANEYAPITEISVPISKNTSVFNPLKAYSPIWFTPKGIFKLPCTLSILANA